MSLSKRMCLRIVFLCSKSDYPHDYDYDYDYNCDFPCTEYNTRPLWSLWMPVTLLRPQGVDLVQIDARLSGRLALIGWDSIEKHY